MDIKTLHLQVNMMFYQHIVIFWRQSFGPTEDIIARTSIVDIYPLHTCTCRFVLVTKGEF